jgi:pimeloyl-ACP methyl ester carboxylesterase
VIARVEGTGRPLVVLHGFGVDHRIMLPLESMVSDMSWRRVYVDLPWAEAVHDAAASSAQDVAEGVLAEVEEHLGTEPFAVIGNSFGGMIARWLAHERRDRVLGLATVAGLVQPDHAARDVPPRTVLHRDDAVLERAGDARDDFAAVSVVQDARSLESFEEYVLPGLRGADPGAMERIAAAYALPAVPEVAHPEPFAAPTLHVLGRQDDVVGYEDALTLRDHYPRGTYAVLDTAGHNVHLEQPGVTGALVRDWLARVDRNAEHHGAA